MTNHVHLVAIPERPDSLALALGQGTDDRRSASRPPPAQIPRRERVSWSSGAGSCEKIPRELK